MFQLDSIPNRICGFNAWNRRTQNTFKAFYALNSTNSCKQYGHSILQHFSFYFVPYHECKDSEYRSFIQMILWFNHLNIKVYTAYINLLLIDSQPYCRKHKLPWLLSIDEFWEVVWILFRGCLRIIFEQIFIWGMQLIAGYFQISQMDRCRKEPQRNRNFFAIMD